MIEGLNQLSDAQRQQVLAQARGRGVYKGRARALPADKASEFARRATAGESVTVLAGEFGISRQTGYRYLAAAR